MMIQLVVTLTQQPNHKDFPKTQSPIHKHKKNR